MAVRTWAQLRAAFANNNTGDITAEDLRNFVDTAEASLAKVEVFTPTIQGSSSDPTVTYTLRQGRYARIGPLVWVSAAITWSASSGGSGTMRVALPLAGAGDNQFSDVLTVDAFGVTFPSGVSSLIARPRPGGIPSADIVGQGPALTSGVNAPLGAIGGAGRIAYSGIYRPA